MQRGITKPDLSNSIDRSPRARNRKNFAGHNSARNRWPERMVLCSTATKSEARRPRASLLALLSIARFAWNGYLPCRASSVFSNPDFDSCLRIASTAASPKVVSPSCRPSLAVFGQELLALGGQFADLLLNFGAPGRHLPNVRLALSRASVA